MVKINAAEADAALRFMRQAAIGRIGFFERELAKLGLRVRMGGEIEFFPLNAQGQPQKKLIDERKITAYLRKHLRGFDNIHPETLSTAAQGEFVTGPNPKMAGTGILDASPSATAETMASFKDAFQKHASRLGLGGVSFRARMDAQTALHNSGLHLNSSVWDAAGKNNLFYERGKPTSDLGRHVIDSLIETHATAGPAYLPHASSFERIASTAHGEPTDTRFLLDVSSGVPNHAGYMSNKGVTLSNLIGIISECVLTGKPSIPSIAGRHSNHWYKPLGLLERILVPGTRTNMIGWETRGNYRVESRLAGADADPYVVTATELASIYDAIKRHTRPLTRPIDESIERLIHLRDGQKLVVDRHPSMKFASIPLPLEMDHAHRAMAADARIQSLLGKELIHGIRAHAGAHMAGIGTNDPELAKLFHESAAYVSDHPVSYHQTTDITRQMETALAHMPASVIQPDAESWLGRMTGKVLGRRSS